MVFFHKANDGKHKYVAVFDDRQVKFGALGYTDYTKSHDEERKRLYLIRHRHENWNDPKTSGALSRWILWNKPTIAESIADYKHRYFL
jgi:hypothetical protein